ncbi:MAG: putative DNA binding domain-containing protein [Thiomargarita sp.]|nr:putative DNA binding domain-containing protein [Thiomargarita sp.]
MTEKELLERINKGETLQTEFKSAKVHPDALAAAFVSFLNSAGGVLLLGVEDDKSITGVGDIDKATLRVEHILAHNIIPPATACIEIIAKILKITLPKGLDRPYHTQRGQCFIRVNAGKRLAAREEIRRMYMDVRAFYYDESTLQNTEINHIDRSTFDDFLNVAYGYPQDDSRTILERKRLLHNLKAMQGETLTVAGVLFFSSFPQQHLPIARIDFARFSGLTAETVILDHKTLKGRLSQQLLGMEDVLRLHLLNKGTIHNFEPETHYEIPLEILREALVNALVHRDYSLSAPIRILMFDDRLEIHSPGNLPNTVTVENIKAGIHVERNPIILSFMAKIGLMTRLGTGILRILSLAKQAELPVPDFIEHESEFVVILYRKQAC